MDGAVAKVPAEVHLDGDRPPFDGGRKIDFL